jgi:hypothetical protein
MVFLVIAAAATTLTVALALSGVTNKPYQQTRLATAGPDVVAILGGAGGPRPAQPVSSTQLAATVASLTTAPGVSPTAGRTRRSIASSGSEDTRWTWWPKGETRHRPRSTSRR